MSDGDSDSYSNLWFRFLLWPLVASQNLKKLKKRSVEYFTIYGREVYECRISSIEKVNYLICDTYVLTIYRFTFIVISTVFTITRQYAYDYCNWCFAVNGLPSKRIRNSRKVQPPSTSFSSCENVIRLPDSAFKIGIRGFSKFNSIPRASFLILK